MTYRPTIVAVPFPLAHGRVLKVELPVGGLTRADADRLGAVIRAWVHGGTAANIERPDD